MARTFVLAITALVPAAFLLITSVIRDRSAAPGSLGATIGVVPAALSVTVTGWALLAGLGMVLGGLSRNGSSERGTSAVTSASPGLGAALAIAGTAAFVLALTASGL